MRLRTAETEDARFTLEIRQSDRNAKYMPKLNVSMEQQIRWLEEQKKSADSCFFVVERLNNEKIGVFSLYNIEKDKAESGRMVIRGNQIEVVETVLLFHDFAFLTMGVNIVYSEIDAANLPATGVAKSVAAKDTGPVNPDDKSCTMRLFVAERGDYMTAREKLRKLVDRFAGRQWMN